MLQFIEVLNTKSKKKVLEGFKPDEGLWVTSDIKSEFFITKQLKKHNSQVSDKCVKRASRFWSLLLSFVRPEICILSCEDLLCIYEEWAESSRKKSWEKGKETGYLICQCISALSHLLQHPMKESLVRQWSGGIKDLSWAKWYYLADEFWEYLKKNGIIESSWVAGYLLDKVPYGQIPYKEIVFDLGFDINKIEAELIRQISKKIETRVLIPWSVRPRDHAHTFDIYGLFDQKRDSQSVKEPTHSRKNVITVKKFATALAEVKDIVSCVAAALKADIPANQISVLAPHIEDYWVCLKSYLVREKIPVNKAYMVSLYTFPVVQLWLAKIQTHLSIINYENMEAVYSRQSFQRDCSQLRADFYHVKQINEWPSGLYADQLLRDKNELTTAQEFIVWIKKLLPDVKSSIVEKSLHACFKRFSFFTRSQKPDKTEWKLKWQSWLHLLEVFVKQEEVREKEEDVQGINCLSFNALGWVESDFIYVAGLSEQNLKKEKHNVISYLEAESITENLGFFINSEPFDKQERIISHFVHQEHKELVLSFSSTDFLGAPLNPSHFWLEKAMECNKDVHCFDTPGQTVWDQQQRKSSVKDILSHTEIQSSRRRLMEESIKEDHGYIKPFYQNAVKSLSPSEIDNYVNCPFIFAAKKVFHLWDGPETGIDIPPARKGIMVHKLFEILQERGEEEISEKGILQIIETIKRNENTNPDDFSVSSSQNTLYQDQWDKKQERITDKNIGKRKIHPVIWKKEKLWLLQKAKLFLKEIKDRRGLFHNYKTKYCEKKYHCYWSFKNQSFSTAGDISFKGKIDYIDSDGKSYQVIDYKNSLAVGSTALSWEAQGNFQMAFYIEALEKGLTDLPSLPVKSGLYLSYKNFEYQGLAHKDTAYIELLGSARKRSLVSEEQKKTILQSVNKKINDIFLSIHNGEFSAEPKTKTLCIHCRWRKICRAKHLN